MDEGLLEECGDPKAASLLKVSPQHGRQLPHSCIGRFLSSRLTFHSLHTLARPKTRGRVQFGQNGRQMAAKYGGVWLESQETPMIFALRLLWENSHQPREWPQCSGEMIAVVLER